MPGIDVAIDARRAKTGADTFHTSADKVISSANKMDGAVAKSNTQMGGLGLSIGKVVAAAGGLIVFRKVAGFVSDSVKEFSRLQVSMAEVNTMLDRSSEHLLPGMERGVRDLSVQYGESTRTLSRGLYDILSASIDSSEALDVLEVSAQAARAGLTSTGVAADALTTIINSYSMEAEDAAEVSDILFATVKGGKTTFDELAQSVGQVAAVAASGGLSLEEMSASLSTMTRAGLQTNMAVTALKGVVTTFLSPTDEAAKVAKQFGLELNKATLETIGLRGAIDLLQDASAEQIAAIFSNVRALTGMATLLEQNEGFIVDLDRAMNSAGSTQEAFAKNTDTLAFAFDQWKASVSDLHVSLGQFNEGPLTTFLRTLTEINKGLSDMLSGRSEGLLEFAQKGGIHRNITGLKPGESARFRDDTGLNTAPPAVNIGGSSISVLDIGKSGASFGNKGLVRPQDQMNLSVMQRRGGGGGGRDLGFSMGPNPMVGPLLPEGGIEELEKVNQRADELNDIIAERSRKQNDLTESTEKLSKAERQRANAIDHAERSMARMHRELEIEMSLLGKVDDERERAIRLARFEEHAYVALGNSAHMLTDEYSEMLEELGRLQKLEELATTVGEGMATAFEDAFLAIGDSSKSMEETIKQSLRSIGEDVIRLIMRQMVTQQIASGVSSTLMEFFTPSAKGNAFSNGSIIPFGKGGVLSGPTIAPMALMGEKGPEAVMPLERGADGKLGVKAQTGGMGAPKIVIQNMSGTELAQPEAEFDGEQWVISVVARNQIERGELFDSTAHVLRSVQGNV